MFLTLLLWEFLENTREVRRVRLHLRHRTRTVGILLSLWDGMGDPPGLDRGDPFMRMSGQQQLIFGSNTKILASPARSYI